MHISIKLFGHEKVSILNGGFAAWTKHGFELQIETRHYKVE
jgi:3-mercaptopyruvate sulfurtransferase SseA